ncbi:MAG: adenine deaminase [Deltaproteobacteria bacterium]|nr:adenine deaminase [Deltaproteobacteria bacterium]
MDDAFTITGQIVDITAGDIFPGRVAMEHGKIVDITTLKSAPERLICPGFIDAHVHIESSLLTPAEFATVAVTHGTICAVSDPHEIANVLGVSGVEYMIKNGRQIPFYFCWGAPSCVPATPFETAGGRITARDIRYLFTFPEVGYLAEMMNYPGVLAKAPEVMEKLKAARALKKPIDGHAPLLRGDDLSRYIAAGISTDHESVSLEEAREKIDKGMKIIIRQGSAARNLNDLLPLLFDHAADCMFCTDDIHPGDLIRGHINAMAREAMEAGVPLLSALRAACWNPARHYGLRAGLLKVGDNADFIVIPEVSKMEVESTYIRGQLVAADGHAKIKPGTARLVNNFQCDPIGETDIQLPAEGRLLKVIGITDGQLVTESELAEPTVEQGMVVSDPSRDILKLVIVNRYERKAKPAVAFVRGFGLERGALAASVGHDSHNITAVGVDDESLTKAINWVIRNKGALVAVEGKEKVVMPLPVAGLMSLEEALKVAEIEKELNQAASTLGTNPAAPFTMLSFMSLIVIPKLKLSDKGLFDVETFQFAEPFETTL